MDGRNIEPRTVLWAVAEVSWQDDAGTLFHASASLEDTSLSGACIRLKTPIAVGSRVTVKWYREQFSAIARNCRSDGREFLLGVRRDTDLSQAQTLPPEKDLAPHAVSPPRLDPAIAKDIPVPAATVQSPRAKHDSNHQDSKRKTSSRPRSSSRFADDESWAERRAFSRRERYALPRSRQNNSPELSNRPSAPPAQPVRSVPFQPEGAPPRRERKAMQSKGFFPNFWRKSDSAGALDKATVTEAPMNKSTPPAEGLTGPQTNLLSYEDIYHAAGILSPRSGYGIHKVVDMLNNDRIRDLSKEVKRASVLMALDAAGTSVDDLLQDATRRQQALSSYEAGQQKQLEEFGARKAQENAQIQAEMERVTSHYAERIQANNDLVAREKEALHNWQMQKQYENQRICEVIEVCGKQSPSAPVTDAQPASASARAAVAPSGTATTRPNLLTEVSTRP